MNEQTVKLSRVDVRGFEMAFIVMELELAAIIYLLWRLLP